MIHEKISEMGTTALIISNEKLENIRKIYYPREDSGLL